MDGCNKQKPSLFRQPGGSVSVHRNIFRSWFTKSYRNPESDRGYQRNGHYKYLLAVGLMCVLPSQALAETVGGVSATAALSPIVAVVLLTKQSKFYKDHTSPTHMEEEFSVRDRPTNFTPYVTGSLFNNIHTKITMTLLSMT